MFHHPRTETTPERISLQYGRRYFVGFGELGRNPEIPPITEAHAEALDALHFLGEKFCVNTHFAKGDMQFVNNLSLFHARDGFLDGEAQRYVVPCQFVSAFIHRQNTNVGISAADISFASG